ncbi:MAG: endonuclease/exonuclease/phosphatase family protein [Bacteroidetes bacterium]|nr:endonuclease/exonuclease/phosphatase family protein [Bacteroidota bacterium]
MKNYYYPQSKKNFFIIILFLLLNWFYLNAQEEKNYRIACIAFYNLENLFDTKDDEGVNDEEYTPVGDKNLNAEKYSKKLKNMASVIAQIGTDLSPDGPAVLGVSEIENKGVLEDLVKEETIKTRNYQIVHYDSPDRRGVDVGFLYNPKYFKVTNSAKYRLVVEVEDGEEPFLTRDQLLVSGMLDGDPLHIIVNHWPSRRGGEKRSRPMRNAAADLCRSITDSILNLDPNAKVIIMGDLNDDPNNESVKQHLIAVGNKDKLDKGELYNTMEPLFRNGIGSLAYQDSWNLFDQIIITPGLLGEDKSTYMFHKAFVFNKNFLKQQSGRYKGYPLRTFAGGVYTAGYSDHFPTYIFLIKEVR